MANKRLIDANALLKWLEECTDENDWLVSQYNADWIWSMLDSAPTVDAVEVVHGEWELHGKDDSCGCSYFCPNCYDSYEEEWFLENGQWNYCPNCGSKMDGGNENDL